MATTAPNPYDSLPEVASFEVRSDDCKHGQRLPDPQASRFLGIPGGEDRSPHLSWSGFPEETKSFVVTVYDPDAPTASGFWHWAVFNIPSSVNELPGGASSRGLPEGAVELRNDAGQPGFVGAAPPPDHGPHRYYTAVHALDLATVDIPTDSTPAYLGFNVFGHTLARAVMVPTYEL